MFQIDELKSDEYFMPCLTKMLEQQKKNITSGLHLQEETHSNNYYYREHEIFLLHHIKITISSLLLLNNQCYKQQAQLHDAALLNKFNHIRRKKKQCSVSLRRRISYKQSDE